MIFIYYAELRSLIPGFGYDTFGNAITVWDEYLEIEENIYPLEVIRNIKVNVYKNTRSIGSYAFNSNKIFKITIDLDGRLPIVLNTYNEMLVDSIIAAHTLYNRQKAANV